MSSDEASASLQLDPFHDVLADFRAGKAVIVVDDADRENEGDICIAAEAVTSAVIAFLMREARGLICVSIAKQLAATLNLPLQVYNNNSPFQTPFAISIDHKDVMPFGVTASSRAYTIKKLLDPTAHSGDFVSPGHVFPLLANEAGVMGRQGHTEGVFDLARLAGLAPAGILCEILNPDGTMARGEQLVQFGRVHGLRMTSIEEIRKYRALHEIAVRQLSSRVVDTDFGPFTATVYIDDAGGKEHLAMVRGDLGAMPTSYAPLVRMHSECLTGDVFGSRRCDCGQQLAGAMDLVVTEGVGVILYLRQEGRGIGLENKVRAYKLQDEGFDTVEANVKLGFRPDERDFAVGAHMLLSMGIRSIRLITNNPNKGDSLSRFGITVVERVPMLVEEDPVRAGYLRTKRDKLGHLL
jgi:3,4-dihydroxy 2-butanone 4-phosphate synthase/GTP cyclohydrolase II